MATWCNARYTLTAFSTWACEAWRTSDLMIQNGKWNNKPAELRMWKFNTVTQTSTKSSILYQFEGTVDTQLVRMASIHTNKNVRIVHMNIKKLEHRYWDTGCMCRYINIIYDIYIQICNGDLCMFQVPKHHDYGQIPPRFPVEWWLCGVCCVPVAWGVKFRSPWKTSSTMARNILGMAFLMQTATRLGGVKLEDLRFSRRGKESRMDQHQHN